LIRERRFARLTAGAWLGGFRTLFAAEADEEDE
jgi:hypothetical protein